MSAYAFLSVLLMSLPLPTYPLPNINDTFNISTYMFIYVLLVSIILGLTLGIMLAKMFLWCLTQLDPHRNIWDDSYEYSQYPVKRFGIFTIGKRSKKKEEYDVA